MDAAEFIAGITLYLECRMRLARLAAVGLAIGLIAGFAVALLRARPRTPAGSVIPLTDDGHLPSHHPVPVGVGAGPLSPDARVLELRRGARG